MKQRPRPPYARLKLFLNVYIAIAVTVLGVLVIHQLGTNNTQNRRLAEQARAIGITNAKVAHEGCLRGNFVREKINVIAGALVSLLRKSVAENERRGVTLTEDQTKFLGELYKKLSPLKEVNCDLKYPLRR